MKIKECTVCGREFQSKNGIEVCSDECAYIRKKAQIAKGNYRRYNGLSGQLETKICPICDKPFEGLREKYCSKECSDIAKKKHRRENFVLWYSQNKIEKS